MNALSRRRFLKISAATFGAGAAATQIPPLTHLAHATAPPGEVRTVPTFCEMCFWRCAGIASVRDGKVWKFEGNPVDPQSRGRLCPRGSGAPGAINDPDRLRTAADPDRRTRQGSVEDGDLGRGAHARRRTHEQDQGRARAGVDRHAVPRHRRALHPARAEELRLHQHGRRVIRAVPRPARRPVST